jgi:hypothetical protein
MSVDYTKVLTTKYAGTLWSLNGDEYDGLDWLDSSPKPTQAELDALWPQVDYETQCSAISQTRIAAYEQTSDPLYFKWQRGDATEAEWREAVAKVKLDNPYPAAP